MASENLGILGKIRIYLEMIKFSHTLFALPFALTGMIIAGQGFPSLRTFLLILLAMVSGRTCAMLLNRIIDAEIDKLNPRTRDRAIPKGIVKIKNSIILAIISGAIFMLSAGLLNTLCFILAPIPLLVFVFYPYTKRFTYLSHFVLGSALGMAPVGAWIAVKGTLPDTDIILLGLAVLFWTAGFDILYALLDIEFDRSAGLRSVPETFGVNGALWISRACHFIAFLVFLLIPEFHPLSFIYLLGVFVGGVLLLYEHFIVRADDLSRLDTAFFNVNASISVIIFVFTFLDVVIIGGGY